LQNRIDGSLVAPQLAQLTVKDAPQLPQKREPAGFSALQLEQMITTGA
jgi:hypothetical protein